jgi:hypothetical protein
VRGDFCGGTTVKVLEEMGEGVGGERSGMYFGREGFEESKEMSIR